MTNTNEKNTMWGGLFGSAPDEIMARINSSIAVDCRLYTQDIRGSIAHASMLAAQNIISDDDKAQIVTGLGQIEQEIASGNMAFCDALEDIHMHIESRLIELIGEPAKRLHTARSRNDQVATDFRLWCKEALAYTDTQLQALQSVLIARAEEYAATIFPGFTHLQTAQPVTLGHHFLAYVEMFGRDRQRMQHAISHMDECPLGAAALAGTSFPIDRHATASALGFAKPCANSLDAVASRDFALETISVLATSMLHLSRLAEELVLWSSAAFGLIRLSDAFSTGSSIMPQKRNPDAAELIRAKTARVSGNLVSLMTNLKALPLAYNKDLQEDKEPVFDAMDSFDLSVRAMCGMIADLEVHTDKAQTAAMQGYSNATDIADWLVQALNIPFRRAHHITGEIVAIATQMGKPLTEVTLEQMQTIEPSITAEVFSVLGAQESVSSRTSYGGTAPNNVKKAIQEARKIWL